MTQFQIGLHYSNSKIKNAGFVFQYNLKKFNKEMIDEWTITKKIESNEIIEKEKTTL